jgi:hypothetical protein
MTEAQNAESILPRQFGLTDEAIFRLWRMAIKDDEELVDDAIAAVYGQMVSFDRDRAAHVMSLIVRRHREAREAFTALLGELPKPHPKDLKLRAA